MALDFITSSEAARRIGVHRTTIWNWVRTGKLTPLFRLNGVPVFDEAQIDRVAAARRSSSVASASEGG